MSARARMQRSFLRGRKRSTWCKTDLTSSPATAELHPRSWRSCVPVTTIVPDGCQEVRRMGSKTASAAADVRAELIAAEREYIYQLLRDGNAGKSSECWASLSK